MLVFVWYTLIYVHPSFAMVLTRKIELVALLLLSFGGLVTVIVLWLFLAVPWVGLQCVIVVLPDHTHLLFFMQNLVFFLVLQPSRRGRES